MLTFSGGACAPLIIETGGVLDSNLSTSGFFKKFVKPEFPRRNSSFVCDEGK
jgi:hypothetical protein